MIEDTYSLTIFLKHEYIAEFFFFMNSNISEEALVYI